MLSVPEAGLDLWRLAMWCEAARKRNNCGDNECLLIAAASCILGRKKWGLMNK